MISEPIVEVIRTVFVFRGIERIVIQCGAIASIVAGTLLYRWGIKGNTNVSGEGAGVKFEVKNAAPGTVLALFGMVVMGIGLANPAKFDEQDVSGMRSLITTAPTSSARPDGSVSVVYARPTSEVDRLLGTLQDQRISDTEPTDAFAVLAARSESAGKLLQNASPGSPLHAFLSEVAAAKPKDQNEARKLLGSYRERAQSLR